MLAYISLHTLITLGRCHVVLTRFLDLFLLGAMHVVLLPRQKGKPFQAGDIVKFKGIDFIVASRREWYIQYITESLLLAH